MPTFISQPTSAGCELLPSAAAFSSMLSAFIGSILNGLLSGFWIAFITGWISWFSPIRILGAGLYEFYLTLRAGADHATVEQKQFNCIGMNIYGRGMDPAAQNPQQPNNAQDEEARAAEEMAAVEQHLATHGKDHTVRQFISAKRGWSKKSLARHFRQPERTLTVFGWLAWVWSAIYQPISQSIWLAVHFSSSDTGLLLVRALAIGVSALALTFDYKHRYGAALAKRLGSWAFAVFNVWTSTVVTLLGSYVVVLLVKATLSLEKGMPIPLLVAYPIFACIWAWVSWKYAPPIDGARPGINIFADVAIGAFVGILVAAPAFGLWQSRIFNERPPTTETWHIGETGRKVTVQTSVAPMNLGDFLQCQGASVLEKFAAIMP